jgi:hypothetical protein
VIREVVEGGGGGYGRPKAARGRKGNSVDWEGVATPVKRENRTVRERQRPGGGWLARLGELGHFGFGFLGGGGLDPKTI